MTVVADQAPITDTQVSLSFGGDAAPGSDYRTVNPVLTLSAGTTSTAVTVQTSLYGEQGRLAAQTTQIQAIRQARA